MHIRIEGTLDHNDHKTYVPHAFTLPPGTQVLTIAFDYSLLTRAADLAPEINVTLFDPQGARGARHNNRDQHLRISEHAATPGYTPGALQPGTWTAWIDVHRLNAPDVLQYVFEIECSSEPPNELPQRWIKGSTAPRGRGWYRGDLHGHTRHSDGAWDVPDFVQYARENRLDFVTLTDHNTVSPLAQHDSYATDDLLTMGGVELTTYYGHMLALGTREWQEWRTGLNDATMPQLAQRAMDSGALIVIAHPKSIGDPWCTGCAWEYSDMMPGIARCVEIWNSQWAGESNNEDAVALWYEWLNDGYRMVATAGTDIHGPLTDPAPGFNVVYADQLSEAAILDAIRAGHNYVSTGAQLGLTAQNASGDHAMMGDLIAGSALEIKASWSGAAETDTLRLMVDGVPHESLSSAETGVSGRHQWTLDGSQARWCTLELRAANGDLQAVTNPILFGAAADWR